MDERTDTTSYIDAYSHLKARVDSIIAAIVQCPTHYDFQQLQFNAIHIFRATHSNTLILNLIKRILLLSIEAVIDYQMLYSSRNNSF